MVILDGFCICIAQLFTRVGQQLTYIPQPFVRYNDFI